MNRQQLIEALYRQTLLTHGDEESDLDTVVLICIHIRNLREKRKGSCASAKIFLAMLRRNYRERIEFPAMCA